jgi:hypothetical protein
MITKFHHTEAELFILVQYSNHASLQTTTIRPYEALCISIVDEQVSEIPENRIIDGIALTFTFPHDPQKVSFNLYSKTNQKLVIGYDKIIPLPPIAIGPYNMFLGYNLTRLTKSAFLWIAKENRRTWGDKGGHFWGLETN